MNHSPIEDGVIRITRDDAMDGHVDDMLKRQLSMRGQPGVTREHGRKWYYQNWLIFMLVGFLGALAAWGIIEPVFDDMPYYQGVITAIELKDLPATELASNERLERLISPTRGSVTINQQKIYLLRNLKELGGADAGSRRVDPASFEVGQTVGVYVEYLSGNDQDLALAAYLVRNPPPQSVNRARLTLAQLSSRSHAAGLVLFALVAGLIGLFVGAADGVVCRLPRRAILCGGVGLLVGLVGGFIASLFAGIAYGPLNALAMKQSEAAGGMTVLGFTIQLFGRSLAWGLAGSAMGLGQGIALRSTRLLLYGLIGGIVGGLLGGLFFDPIDMILLGTDKPSSHWSRLIGFLVIGGSVGAMIGIVELLARDAWLRMTQGPLCGKEFLIFKDVMNVGSSPRSDIFLFNDPAVAEQHAVIRAVGDSCEIESRQAREPVLLNNRAITRARLRHGDTVTVGRTAFVFQQRKS